ncbi:hypothetical protein J6590_027255 [Homalodisca vitripennis]|nr:hypothetical protein J6590_027255 [Homalodisca vitripennis]
MSLGRLGVEYACITVLCTYSDWKHATRWMEGWRQERTMLGSQSQLNSYSAKSFCYHRAQNIVAALISK